MVEEIILRIADQQYQDLQLQIAQILRKDFKISLLDDSVANPLYKKICSEYKEIICLSLDIKLPKNEIQNPPSYFKISRVFDEDGNHFGWYIPTLSKSLLRLDSPLLSKVMRPDAFDCCIVDSDISTGSTRDTVLRLFSGAGFFAPISLKSHQDLVDVEDLVLKRSLIWKRNELSYANYLYNKNFFCKRTSILSKSYDPILKLVYDSLPQRNLNS